MIGQLQAGQNSLHIQILFKGFFHAFIPVKSHIGHVAPSTCNNHVLPT